MLHMDIIDCSVFYTVLNIISVISCRQCTYSCFPGDLSTIAQHSVLSKPLAAFPHMDNAHNKKEPKTKNIACGCKPSAVGCLIEDKKSKKGHDSGKKSILNCLP